MWIKNGSVLTEDGTFEKKDIRIEDGRIAEIVGSDLGKSLNSETGYDATGCYVIPGLVDIHSHGCVDRDACDASVEAIREMAKYEASVGVTTYVPTTMTYPEDRLISIAKAIREYRENENEEAGRAFIAGINMEGPFISPAKVGAQNPKYVSRADAGMFRRINEASGNAVLLCDIAPEEEGAIEFVKAVSDETRISIAHTCATYEEAAIAYRSGAKHLTHMFNAMPPLSHRAPGPIAAAAETDFVTAEIICDGVHVYPPMVNMAYKVFGPDRLIMISDSMRATGLPDGEYELGGQPVTVRGNRATLHDGTIAGSATNLFDCMMNAVKTMGIPLAGAVRCASENPAKAIGMFDEVGSISVGKKADLVLVSEDDLERCDVFVRGHRL